MNTRISSILSERTLVQTLGSGGVGKTSLSVVLGIFASRLGKKTLVITIDPSKRLMDTLKISSDKDIQYVKEFKFDAMMIDVEKCWNLILSRYASPSTHSKIVKNRFNRYLKDYFPNFDEYIASEMIYYMMNVKDYDIIIVDSPPSVYAISYLEASNRIIEVLSNDFILSLIPYINLSSSPFKYIMKKELFILKNIARFTGMEMLTELIKFINDLSPLLSGFKQRADFIKRFYSSRRSGFFVVTLPNDVSFKNSKVLIKYLNDLKYQLDGVFINRVCLNCGGLKYCNLRGRQEIDPESLIDSITDSRLKEIVKTYFKQHIREQMNILKRTKEFINEIGSGINIFAVPEMSGYIKSTEDILEIFKGIESLKV